MWGGGPLFTNVSYFVEEGGGGLKALADMQFFFGRLPLVDFVQK